MSCGSSHRRRCKDYPDRERGPVPDRVGGSRRPRHARASGCAPELVDGRQNLGQFGDDDEQGPRTHRGTLSVRPSLRPHRRPDSPAIGGSFARRVRRRLGARAARSARYANSRSLTRSPGPSGSGRRRSGSTWRRSRDSISKPRISTVFPRFGSRARRSREAPRRRSYSTRRTRSPSPRFWPVICASPKSRSSSSARSTRWIARPRIRSTTCWRSTGSRARASRR